MDKERLNELVAEHIDLVSAQIDLDFYDQLTAEEKLAQYTAYQRRIDQIESLIAEMKGSE